MKNRMAILAMTAALGLVSLGAGRSWAKCDDDDPSGALRAAARADVKANCNCATATNHGEYVHCSKDRLKNNNPSLPRSCRGKVQKCAAKSTCGKPGFIICCKVSAKGKAKCAPKKDCAHCVPPANGQACCSANSSCCCGDATSSCSATAVTAPCAACTSPSGAFLE